MPIEYLKKAKLTAESDGSNVRAAVQQILSDIEAGGDEAALNLCQKVR